MKAAPLIAAIATLALAGCGIAATSHPAAPATSISTLAGPSAADNVLSADYFAAGATEIRPPAGATSAACGFNGNVEEVAIVYHTPAQMWAAASFHSEQAASAGMSYLVVTADVHDGPTVVTVVGDDSSMSEFAGQFGSA
jgi:hypothetical protein